MVLLFFKKILVQIHYSYKPLPGRVLIKKKSFRKEAPRCFCCEGSFTLEAAVIVPLLACLFVSLLFFFRIMQIELEVQKALDDTGRKLAVNLTADE